MFSGGNIEVRKNEAWFNGLTFRRDGDSLKIYLVLVNQGERTEHTFDLERVPL